MQVWFDAQQLAPGADWSAGIQAGLRDCRGVILVASESSLSSPYVKLEWEAAIGDGKPVHVAVFEAAHTPEGLNPSTVVDMRQRFKRGVKRLANALDEERTIAAARIPAPPRTGIRGKFPFSLWIIIFGLVMAGYSLFSTAFSTFLGMVNQGEEAWVFNTLFREQLTQGPMLAASANDGFIDWANLRMFLVLLSIAGVFVGIGVLYVREAWKFSRRKFTYRSVRIYLATAALFLFIVSLLAIIPMFGKMLSPGGPVGLGPSSSGEVVWYVTSGAFGLVLSIGGFILPILGFRLMARSDNVYRWLPTGQAAPKRRRRYGKRHGVDEKLVDPDAMGGPVAYALSYAPGDARIAGMVERQLEKSGHQHLASGEAHQYNVAVLSNLTPASMLSALVTRPGVFVPILATGVDVTKDVPDASKHQWIDFRRMLASQLRSLAEFLRLPGKGARAYGLSVLPQALQKHVLPARVATLAWALRVLAILLILKVSSLVVQIFGILPMVTYELPLKVSEAVATTSLFAHLSYAVVMLWTANLLVQRQVGGQGFFTLLVGFVICHASVALLVLPQMAYLLDPLILVAYVCIAVGAMTTFQWLPVGRLTAAGESTIHVSSKSNVLLKVLRDLSIGAVLAGGSLWLAMPTYTDVQVEDIRLSVPMYFDRSATAVSDTIDRPTEDGAPAERPASRETDFADSGRGKAEIAKDLTPPGGKVVWVTKAPALWLEAVVIRLSAQRSPLAQLEALAEQLMAADEESATASQSDTYDLEALPSGYAARRTHVLKRYQEKDAPLFYERYWIAAVDTGAATYLLALYQPVPRPARAGLHRARVEASAPTHMLDLDPMLRKMIRSIVTN